MTDLIMLVASVAAAVAFLAGMLVGCIAIAIYAAWRALREERKVARQVGELVVVLLIVLSASTASAEPTWAFKTAKQRQAAGVASWVTLGTLATLETVQSLKYDQPGRALAIQATRMGVTYGGVFLAKTLVHRARPCAPDCGIDNPHASFFSGHSAGAAQAIDGSRLSLTLTLALGTGALRELADKHYLTDIAAGWIAGYAARRGTDYVASRWFR
jgi:membrane-associated phospholipid phosphatase